MKVLLVEDDVQTTELMTLRLESLGCDVLTAATALEAIEAAARERPALVLADLDLPGGLREGATLLDELASDPRTADIPVYVHSVYVSHQSDLHRIDVPALGFLLKPLRVPDLRTLLEMHRTSDGAATADSSEPVA